MAFQVYLLATLTVMSQYCGNQAGGRRRRVSEMLIEKWYFEALQHAHVCGV